MDGTVRQARAEDADAVAAFASATWSDREVTDYVPDVFPEWVATDGPDQRTVVLDTGGDIAGVCQGVMLTDEEAWAQGIRVNPAFRGEGVGTRLTEAVFDWARGRGATVCRNLVFSWNAAGLGQSRAVGFAPATEFRFAHPAPDPDAESDAERSGELTVEENPAAVWRYWQGSDAARHLRGLGLDPDETWALSEVSRERVAALADDEWVAAVRGDAGTRAATARVREYESGDGTTYAEYGFAGWDDLPAARTVLAAVRRDAARLGVDATRVLFPETPRYVSDAAYAHANIGEEPEFVMAKDLTGH
jgi:GNAT superfamily N-acetyltransferase